MKNLFTLCAILLLCHPLSLGQKIKFTDSGNRWSVLFAKYENGAVVQQGFSYETYDTVTINHILYRHSNFGDLREDTALGKVFIKNALQGQDTMERLLYDYNLNIGDTITLYFNSDSSRITLLNADSVQADSQWYKVYHIGGYYRSFLANNIWVEYTVIEGIGCLDGPWWPLQPYNPEGGYGLQCFHQKWVWPVLDRAVDNWFDNYKSCYLSINKIRNNRIATVAPNPVTINSKIIFPDIIGKGNLTITNSLGQIVFSQNFNYKNSIQIGDKINTPGLYFYRITNEENNTACSGKFVSE